MVRKTIKSEEELNQERLKKRADEKEIHEMKSKIDHYIQNIDLVNDIHFDLKKNVGRMASVEAEMVYVREQLSKVKSHLQSDEFI